MDQTLEQDDTVVVDGLGRQADFALFLFAGVQGAQVGELDEEAFFGVDEETFLNEAIEAEGAGRGAQ